MYQMPPKKADRLPADRQQKKADRMPITEMLLRDPWWKRWFDL